MSFSCKILLGWYGKSDKTRMVYLRAIIDRKAADVPLGFYISEDSFDARRQCMKAGHPNAKNFDNEFLMAKAKANNIASRFRQENKLLTPLEFKNEFINPSDTVDLIKFIATELELKRPSIAENTYKQHLTVINKLKAFRKQIPFNHLSGELMQNFRNELIRKGMSPPTVNKILKIVKQWLGDARKKGMKFKDSFDFIKIKNFKSNKQGLSQEEVEKMQEYYEKQDCDPKHRKLLRYFLFSCYTSLRISDVSAITWNNIHSNLLIYIPVKTKFKNEKVTVPLNKADLKLLPEFKPDGKPIFDTYSDPVTNRYLKEVADRLGIRKRITFHTARHTFGSLFANKGGNLMALQKMMGHSVIKTTMEYAHANVQSLIDAKNEVFGE